MLFDGFEELDAMAPYGVFQNAAALDGVELEVRLVAVDGPLEVVAEHGLRVFAEDQLGDAPDLLVVPGGGWLGRAPRGTRAELDGPLPGAIARAHAAGTTIASVCTGAMLVAGAGISEGRPATTNRSAVEDLRETGAEVIEARVVDDGDLVSAAGITSGLDLALWLVENHFGPGAAVTLEAQLEYERRGTVWRRAGR